jgi:DNA-binding ferritin-like protein
MTSTSTDVLKTFLADTYTLMLKTHTFRWNVAGTRFYDPHLMFEEQYRRYDGRTHTRSGRLCAGRTDGLCGNDLD